MADSFENLEHLKSQYVEPQTFNVNGINYSRITDSNYGVYSNGQLRYNVQSLYASSASEKPVYELSEAYLQVYITNTLSLTNATFPDATVPQTTYVSTNLDAKQNVFQVHNKNGLALKDPIALVNQFWFTMSNQEVITSPTHSYFYNLLKLRCENKEELDKKMAVVDRVLDNGQSMIRDPVVGEMNNFNSETIAKDIFGLDEVNSKNVKYGKKFIPYGKAGANPYLLEAGNFDETALQNLEIPYMKWVDATTIKYYDIIKIYLKDMDDFFKNAPSLLQIPKFNLTVNTNISDTTSWSVTLGRDGFIDSAGSNPNLACAVASATGLIKSDTTANAVADVQSIVQSLNKFYFHPTKVEASLNNATCCPWLLSDIGLSRNNSLRTGLNILPSDTANTVPVVKISSKFGWDDKKLQTYLIIPQINWNPKINDSIITNVPYNFYVRKATIDMNTFANQSYGSVGIKKPLNNSWSRVRNIYLVPMSTAVGLSTGSKSANPVTFVQTGVKPYESPLSSAPITNSNIYLSRVQIWQGGKPLLPVENNFSPIDMYDNQLYRVMNENGGNSVLSSQSGMISKYDWKGAYHYYKYDLSKYNTDAVADNNPKSFEIGFDISSKAPKSNTDDSANTCDVIVIVEFEGQYKINRFTGLFAE